MAKMFYRYIQEGEKLKGDFTKAMEFISKIETIRNLSFKKDNEQDYWLDWNNEIKNYRTSLERYKKIWSNV